MNLLLWLCLNLFLLPLFAVHPDNPFKISFEAKKELTYEDFNQVQKQLRQINLHPLLHRCWRDDGTYSHYTDFWIRCSRGTRQELINPEKGFYPKQQLLKIGKGGDQCIVCCAPYRIVEEDAGTRAGLIGKISRSLEETGFNGHFLFLVGGFPNPTGEEICYAGVPYAFKIFMMLEAYKLGFNHVLWIDSACLPINDPTPLFEELKEKECLLHLFPSSPDAKLYIFEETAELLYQLTGTRVLKADYLVTIVFGLKMDAKRVQHLIDQYYALVDLGTPFLSCFPEEFVLSALIGKPEFRIWKRSRLIDKMFTRANENEEDSPLKIESARRAGYFFYQLKH